MISPRVVLLPLAWALAVGPSVSRAAGDESADAPIGIRAFGEISTWFDRVGDERVPIEQQPLREPGNRALTPPRLRRDGLQPRIAAIVELNDNVLLTAEDRRPGHALIVSPGLNWIERAPRYRVEVDMSIEALKSLSSALDDQSIDAATVQAFATGQPSERTSAVYLGTLLHSHDPGVVLPGLQETVGNQRFASDFAYHQLGLGWRSTPQTDLETRFIATRARSDVPDFIPTDGQDIEVAARWRPEFGHRIGVRLRDRSARFADRPTLKYRSLWAELESQLSPTLLVTAAVAPTRGTGGDDLILWRLTLLQTFRDGQWEGALEREVTAPGGLGAVYEVRSLRVGASWRIGHSSRLEASVQLARYSSRADADNLRTLRARLSYSVPLAPQWWFNLRYQGIEDEIEADDFRRRGNRVMATLLWTL